MTLALLVPRRSCVRPVVLAARDLFTPEVALKTVLETVSDSTSQRSWWLRAPRGDVRFIRRRRQWFVASDLHTHAVCYGPDREAAFLDVAERLCLAASRR